MKGGRNKRKKEIKTNKQTNKKADKSVSSKQNITKLINVLNYVILNKMLSETCLTHHTKKKKKVYLFSFYLNIKHIKVHTHLFTTYNMYLYNCIVQISLCTDKV